jgi:hypothetical protein
MAASPPDLATLHFLDFETNKKGDFYLVGLASAGEFKQVFLTPKLHGLASELKSEVIEPKNFARSILRDVRESSGSIVAYSTAEKNILLSILSVEDPVLDGITYCNLAKAARRWIRKYKQEEFEALPPLVKTANDFSKKRHPKSLASVCRLINFNAPGDYAIGKTTSRLNAVINGLEKKDQQYSDLTAVQKAKATKAIKHNRYDVESMIALFDAIQSADPKIIEKATSPLL